MLRAQAHDTLGRVWQVTASRFVGTPEKAATTFLYDARSFVPQNQWRLRSVILARQDSVVERRHARSNHPHKHLPFRNFRFRKINQLQIQDLFRLHFIDEKAHVIFLGL